MHRLLDTCTCTHICRGRGRTLTSLYKLKSLYMIVTLNIINIYIFGTAYIAKYRIFNPFAGAQGAH